MSAQEIWEGMVRVGSNMTEKQPMPYHLDDPDEMVEFLDEDSKAMAMGRDAVSRENDADMMGTYLH
ncbi:MAG: hypothetical protein KA369_21065 [Spirochaetes bacterium]|nr:hypothetical protein [Spirochaetota bacterium]